MRIESPTQKKIKQREKSIIEAAIVHIEQSGFGSLTLDKLAQDVNCSKGTVYNHFANKEDLLVELGILACQRQQYFFNKLNDYEGNSREKIMALFLAYQIYSFINPALFSCTLNIQNSALIENAKQERLEQYHIEEMRVVSHLVTTIQGGVDAGDVKANDSADVLRLAFTGWALAFGNISLMMSSQGAFLTRQADREKQLLMSVQMLLDGGGWLPLSGDKNYEKSWSDVGKCFFSEEIEELKQRELKADS